MMQPGQVVRYENELWRVEYVNPSRAYLLPLARRTVIIRNDEGAEKRRFEGGQRGVNVSPNSVLDIVEDPERARAEQELAEAEEELRQLRAEAARAPAERASGDWRPHGHAVVLHARPGAGWHLLRTEEVAPGSLKAAVLGFLAAHPGSQTRVVAAACPGSSAGAVAACLDRFLKAGVVTRK